MYLISTTWFVFFHCKRTGDLLAALIVFSLETSSEIGSVKLFSMFVNRKKIKELVTEFLAFDALVAPGSRYSKNLMKTLRHVKRRAIIFWLVIIMNGVVYVIKPIVLPGRHFMEDHLILYGLTPTSMYETPYYQIAFILMTGGVCFTCYVPANITAFLIVITGYIEAQILALREELAQLWSDAEDHYLSNNDSSTTEHTNNVRNVVYKERARILNVYVNKVLKEIIRNHAKLINLVKLIERVFRGAIALEFALLTIGLIVELLGGLENTYIDVPFALMQVGMDCFIGQRIMDASDMFCRTVYECKWECFDRRNMKLVLLMLQNSQKTLTLSAGGVTILSFRCLMSVIRSIYSAYTTLRTTMNQ